MGLAFRLRRAAEDDRRAVQRLFAFSIVYLFVLFAALLTGDGDIRWSLMLETVQTALLRAAG
jgi:protoheme IX farnesyltransferase